jgi:glycosyltransferase involved in cell wall biosynthesis
MVLPLYERVIALSGRHADYLVEKEGVKREKITVINNGVDDSRFTPSVSDEEKARMRRKLSIPEGSIVVIIVAALRPEKNHRMFLDVASRLSAKRKDLLFLVVGDGLEKEKLLSEAAGMTLENSLRFLGRRKDIPEILKCSDISVLCSYPVVETFPVTVLEAMASGLPVISTDVGSVGDIIRDGEDGFLIESDDRDALAARIEELAGDPRMRDGMGRKGRKRVVDNFSTSIMLDNYNDLFRSLL